MALHIPSATFIQFCRENIDVYRFSFFKIGPARDQKRYTNFAHHKGKGCLSVAVSRRLLCSWLELQFGDWWKHPTFPGQSCSMNKAGRQGVYLRQALSCAFSQSDHVKTQHSKMLVPSYKTGESKNRSLWCPCNPVFSLETSGLVTLHTRTKDRKFKK